MMVEKPTVTPGKSAIPIIWLQGRTICNWNSCPRTPTAK